MKHSGYLDEELRSWWLGIRGRIKGERHCPQLGWIFNTYFCVLYGDPPRGAANDKIEPFGRERAVDFLKAESSFTRSATR